MKIFWKDWIVIFLFTDDPKSILLLPFLFPVFILILLVRSLSQSEPWQGTGHSRHKKRDWRNHTYIYKYRQHTLINQIAQHYWLGCLTWFEHKIDVDGLHIFNIFNITWAKRWFISLVFMLTSHLKIFSLLFFVTD